MNYTKQMQRIIGRYERSTGKTSYTSKEVARWAIDNEQWKPQPEALVKKCADDVSRALREEYETDPQGRRARVKHSALIKQEGEQLATSMWFDSRRATCEQMELCFQQKRKGIVSDCKQLKTDVDSYNENYNQGDPIPIGYDFTEDLLEAELANTKKTSATVPQRPSRQFSDVVRRSAS